MSLLLLLVLLLVLDQTQASAPDRNTIIRHYDLGAVHTGDFARVIVPLDLLDIVYHSEYLLKSLSIFEELHSPEQAGANHWHAERLQTTSMRKALDAIKDASNDQIYPLADFNSHNVGIHGTLSTQQQYVRQEILAIKTELQQAIKGLHGITQRFSYLPLDPDPMNKSRRTNLDLSLQGLQSHLNSLDLNTFKTQNARRKRLLYEEIHEIISKPRFAYPNVTFQAQVHSRARCTADNLNFQALLHYHAHVDTPTSTITYAPWVGVTPTSRKRRQVAAGLGLVGVGVLVGNLFSNFVSSLGFGHSSYATKSEMGELLHSLQSNQNSVFKLTKEAGELRLIDEHLIARQKKLFLHLSKLSRKMYKLTLAQDFQQDLAYITPLLGMIKDRISKVIMGVEQASSGTFPTALVDLNLLKDKVKELYQEAGKMGFEKLTDDLRILLTSQTKVIFLDGKITFLIDVPVKPIGEPLARLIQIPRNQVLVQESISYALNMEYDFYQIKEEKSLFAPLQNNAFHRCKLFDEQISSRADFSATRENDHLEKIYFCPLNKHGWDIERNVFQKYTKTHCLASVLSKNKQTIIQFCPFQIRPLAQQVVTKLPDNHFLMFSPEPILVKVYCYTSPYHLAKEQYYLTNTFRTNALNIHLRPNCYMETDLTKAWAELSPSSNLISLSPVNIQFNEWELFHTLRYLMQNQIHSHQELEQQIKLLANGSDLQSDINRLRKMAVTLDTVKKAAAAPLPRFNENPVYRYVESAMIILASILMSCLFFYFIFRVLPPLMERVKASVWTRASSEVSAVTSRYPRLNCCGTTDDADNTTTDGQTSMEGAVVARQGVTESSHLTCESKIAALSLALRSIHGDVMLIKAELAELKRQAGDARATLR